MTRKTISLATVTLHVKKYQDGSGVDHVDIAQTVTGGIPGTQENRTLSWEEGIRSDHVFGQVKIKARRAKVEDIENEFLKEGWTADTLEHGVIESYEISDTSKNSVAWTSHQVWGFKEVQGKRMYARNIIFVGPKGEEINAHLYYDYLGPI